MIIYSEKEVEERFINCNFPGGSLEYEDDGQLIIYTNMYQWSDGTVRDEPEPVDVGK